MPIAFPAAALPMSPAVRTLRFRTDDPDEALDRLARAFGGHSRVPERRGPFGYDFLSLGTGRLAVGTVDARNGSTLRGTVTGFTLHLPLGAAATYRIGRSESRVAEGTGMALAAGHTYTARIAAGAWIALRMDQSLLADALDARVGGQSRAWAAESFAMPALPSDVAFARRTLASLSALARSPQRGQGSAIEAFECGAAAWLAERLLKARGARAVPRDGIRVAEGIERWIREHCAAPLALEDLAAVAGVGGRALQKACLARWGLSPLELVASHRLAAARQRLLHAKSLTTVTQAATESGFTHLGRFAVAYKGVYGELPRETLERGMRSRSWAHRRSCGQASQLRRPATAIAPRTARAGGTIAA